MIIPSSKLPGITSRTTQGWRRAASRLGHFMDFLPRPLTEHVGLQRSGRVVTTFRLPLQTVGKATSSNTLLIQPPCLN